MDKYELHEVMEVIASAWFQKTRPQSITEYEDSIDEIVQ